MSNDFGVVRAPRNLVFGAGQRRALAGFARALGTRPLVVTDERLVGEDDFRIMMDALEAAGLSITVFDGTVAELPVECLAAGLDLGQKAGVDLVIGIGGGSCIDAAKIIALLLSHGGEIADYYGEFKVPGPVLPLIAMPTTSGTGSEVTPVAVVADPDRALKVGIASPHLIPHTAICDPELTYSCPPGLTATSGADALTHAIEALTTMRREPEGNIVHEHVFLGKNLISDHYAREAIRLISGSLERAVRNGSDREARDRLMLGATMAGLAFGTAGTAAAHAVQYPVGALTHTPHGTGVAVMLPYVMAFNLPFAAAEMAEIASIMGVGTDGAGAGNNAAAAVDAVAGLFSSIGIPPTLKALGLAEDKLAWTAEAALGVTRLVKNNPRPLDADAMTALVEAAFHGDRSSLTAPQDDRKAI